jgi:hypothetical protein
LKKKTFGEEGVSGLFEDGRSERKVKGDVGERIGCGK